ncbi:hypothetical protein FOQG_19637 [Fusarium oxysporum f. sp. raphani 54005]|uniref:Uncharacterized protein n=1 Tax=Fusarium oxysporum f. sp. raphani 54005 TaxID=1089458 RepID=X0B1H1_FUSOX|nr:hypothetical protein FOQG_19637 [Fusarium oxysporum f. sp. raphani 54005]
MLSLKLAMCSRYLLGWTPVILPFSEWGSCQPFSCCRTIIPYLQETGSF